MKLRTCETQDLKALNPCWHAWRMFLASRWFIICLVMMCSWSLQRTEVRDTGL